MTEEMICRYTAANSVLTPLGAPLSGALAHQTKKEADIGRPPSRCLRRPRRMVADLHDGAGWDRLALARREGCHTPCPCHASQPQSSHTDANQGRLPRKEVPEKCPKQCKLREKNQQVGRPITRHNNLPYSRPDWRGETGGCVKICVD